MYVPVLLAVIVVVFAIIGVCWVFSSGQRDKKSFIDFKEKVTEIYILIGEIMGEAAPTTINGAVKMLMRLSARLEGALETLMVFAPHFRATQSTRAQLGKPSSNLLHFLTEFLDSFRTAETEYNKALYQINELKLVVQLRTGTTNYALTENERQLTALTEQGKAMTLIHTRLSELSSTNAPEAAKIAEAKLESFKDGLSFNARPAPQKSEPDNDNDDNTDDEEKNRKKGGKK